MYQFSDHRRSLYKLASWTTVIVDIRVDTPSSAASLLVTTGGGHYAGS